MKAKSVLLIATFFFGSAPLFSQNIKAQTADMDSKYDFNAGISPVIDNHVYVYNIVKRNYEVAGYNVSDMKRTVEFSVEYPEKAISTEVVFLENRFIIFYFDKKDLATTLVDIYDLAGKKLDRKKKLMKHKFMNEEKVAALSEPLVSANGKYLLLCSNGGTKGREYTLFDASLNIVWTRVIKMSGANDKARILNTVLTNDGKVGVFIASMASSNEFKLLKASGESEAYTEIKIFGKDEFPSGYKFLHTNEASYMAGLYKNNEQVGIIKGPYSIKINSRDLSVSYARFGEFTEEQAKEYNARYLDSKSPAYKREVKADPEHFHQGDVNSISLDQEDNIAFSVTAFYHNQTPDNYFWSNVNIAQFKLKNDGIGNFKVLTKDQHIRDHANQDYIGAIILSDNTNIYSIYNENESNLNKAEGDYIECNKRSLLACACSNKSDKISKKAMLEDDKNVLILPEHYVWADPQTLFVLSTRDKGNIVLVKISIT